MPQSSTFTPNDAQLVLNIAQSASIPNMEQAQARAELFARYVAWVNEAFAALDSKPSVPPLPAAPGGFSGER